jgi:motility quorum-sensing regulator/GCU-specific mRNA interferase toxin
VEKLRPSYDLEAIKRAIGSPETLSATGAALRDAYELGFTRRDMASVNQTVWRPMFYKSMTTFADPRLWQDVYHVPSGSHILYVKFQADVVTQFSLVSFKER